MIDFLMQFTFWATWVLIVYYAIYNGVFLVVLLKGALEVSREVNWPSSMTLSEIFANPLTPGISIIVPAHNEESGIVDAVLALRNLRYPLTRIVVVDDGSTDETFQRLKDNFDLRPTSKVLAAAPQHEGKITELWATRSGDLTVVRKESVRLRSDAVNAGLRAADQEIVCMIDADSLLERDALLHIVAPFVADPTVLGVGGVIRPANGVTVSRGAVTKVQMPKKWVERIQVVEYLRAFLVGRTGWASIKGLMIISGAFGAFRRDAVLEVGGLDSTSLAEDADLVVAITKKARDEKRPYRIAFVAEPVCWTEVPNTFSALSTQRRRWSQGLGELIAKQRKMILNPRYGVLGMLTLPYFVLFEFYGPIFGVLGAFIALAGAITGLITWQLFALAFFVSVGLSLVSSLASVLIEESAYHRYSRLRDVVVLLMTTIVELMGFHLVHTWWRLQGVYRALFKRPSEWGTIERAGFEQEGPGHAPDDSPDQPQLQRETTADIAP
ncbi:glycosyltransferase family 2 protein [Salinibacterium sp. SWN139]|uniref:glycosyltransferase family 2 protein n=1 Tax=Salinibacterium sp. SWN139 TaxID=2792055 RepID=UPI0018CF466C|nr:glycosyltransferase [Salinibacterium sp. SWN139]MBH0052830.1 glycosyltransferase family 2 protein [Salinibacterium sp. SWN139]